MSRFRLLAGLLVVTILAGTSLSADDTKPSEKKDTPAKGTLPPNWKKLGLTDAQVQKVYKIESDYRAKIADLEQQIKDLRAKERKELETVLTDAQKARLKELKEGTDEKKPESTTKPADSKKP